MTSGNKEQPTESLD